LHILEQLNLLSKAKIAKSLRLALSISSQES